ncbi:MAG: PASTA domain-containing protein [Prevotella sp.]|nr:PASTA domain-containing protein [Candidatus Prevotella equi]
MKPSEFISKLTGRFLWLNLLAMAVVVILLVIGAAVAMDVYTHHGESIAIPDVRKHSYESSVKVLEDLGFEVVVNDTGYVKTLPPGTILEQIPQPGTHVKSGRVIYLTINALDSPTLALPDLIDNSSMREAMAKLKSMGFKLGTPQLVPGEKDWVYGILADGKSVVAGQRVSIESILIVQVGNGLRDAADSVYVSDKAPEQYDYYEGEELEVRSGNAGETDDFEVIE